MTLPTIAIIGAGKVGTTMAFAAQQQGYRVAAIAGRNKKNTEEAAGKLAGVKVCSATQAAKEAQIVFLTVSDDAIEPLCIELSKNLAFSEGQIVAHCSGALSSEILASARATCGAKIASVHPLQTFSTFQSAVEAMPGTFWFCEGDKEALEVLSQLIEKIGGIPQVIPSDKKVLYHCASVIACNYLVSLMDLALKVAESASLDRDLAWQALSPIIQATITNIGTQGTSDALTGPIARGDVNTVLRHLNALSNTNQEITDIYKILGAWTTQLAIRKGLSQESAEELARVFNSA